MQTLGVQLSPSDYENTSWWFLESVLLYLRIEAEYHGKKADEDSE